MRFLSIILTLLSLTIVCLAQPAEKPTATPDVPVPQILVRLQPEAPVRISAQTSWALPANRSLVQIFIVVENVSGKVVRAYATRRGSNASSEPKACFPMNLLPGQVLQSGQKDGRSTWQPPWTPESAQSAWVDFVEFADGTVWGADECHSGERLDGERSGARAQQGQLLKVLQEEGPDAVIKSIRDHAEREANFNPERGEAPQPLVAPPAGHSRRWEASFAQGATTIRLRVIEAHQRMGPSAIEAVLRNPYDASDVR